MDHDDQDDAMGRRGIKALSRLGFSETEAAAYCQLLVQSPGAAEQIGAATGMSAANVARALSFLEKKGAVVVDSDDPSVFRAVPPRELLDGLSLSFELDCDDAERTLAGSFVASEDHRMYTLTRPEQVSSKARNLIEAARETLLLDMAPEFADELADAVVAARDRGVRIGVILYSAHDAYVDKRTPVVLHPPEITARLAFSHLTVVSDARDTLLASFTPDGEKLAHAAWTGSHYLSCFFHNGVVTELLACAHLDRLAPGSPGDDVILALAFTQSRPPGFRAMAESIATLMGIDRSKPFQRAKLRVVPKD